MLATLFGRLFQIHMPPLNKPKQIGNLDMVRNGIATKARTLLHQWNVTVWDQLHGFLCTSQSGL